MMPAPVQSRFDEWIGPLLGRGSPEFAAFQSFATALVRGDMTTVMRLTDAPDITERASRAHLSLRRRARDVLQVAYRADQEQRSPDGMTATLEVSQGFTLDPPGVTSALGTFTCEGRYEVMMAKVEGAWRVASLVFKPPARQPAETRFAISPGGDILWPCADRAWTEFATAWKSTALK